MEKKSIVCDEDGDDGGDQLARSQSERGHDVGLVTEHYLQMPHAVRRRRTSSPPYPLDGVKGDAS